MISRIFKRSLFFFKPFSSKPDLSDSFLRFHNYLRISLSERCNLRCVYCMPEAGVDLTKSSELLTFEEIIRLSKFFVRNGVTKIKLTGGEPTIRKDLPMIISELNKLRKDGLANIGITTNGIKLRSILPDLIENGLESANISLDTLDENQYMLLTRRNGFKKVMESIKVAISLNIDLKINCVVMNGINTDQIIDFCEMTNNPKLSVRFIEYMPFNGNNWKTTKVFPMASILKIIGEHYGDRFVALKKLKNDTTKYYKIIDYSGKIGIISSITNHFCADCNRIRITADGYLRTCLFGKDEYDLKPFLRNKTKNNDDLLKYISDSIKLKNFAHGGNSSVNNMNHDRPMIKIGG